MGKERNILKKKRIFVAQAGLYGLVSGGFSSIFALHSCLSDTLRFIWFLLAPCIVCLIRSMVLRVVYVTRDE